MPKTITQFNLFDEPEVKRVRKTRKDKKTPEQKAADKEEREAKKKLEKDKEWERKWAERGVKQGSLFGESLDRIVDKVITENVNRIITESFASQKLAQLTKQHGGLDSLSTYQASTLTDQEIGNILPQGESAVHNLRFKDGTRVKLNLTPEHSRLWQKGTPEIERRFKNHNGTTPDHHVKNYDWTNYDAQRAFGSGKYTGHIAPGYKEQTPMNQMGRGRGDSHIDKMGNWRQEYPKDKTVQPYNYNTSRYNNALIQYKTRGMSDKDKKQFIINMIGKDRVIDMH